MSSGRYFSKFQAITYKGQIAKNILNRVKISDESLNNSTSFYNYSIPQGKRADALSNDYYKDPDFSWLIYLTNGITDPYHDYYMSEENFNAFITKKYGSIQAASNTIHSWVLSWGVDENELSPVQYEALPGHLKRYWVGVTNNVYLPPHKYVRDRSNLVLRTNRSVVMQVQNPNDFNLGMDYLGQDADGNEFSGVVTSKNGNIVSLDHVIGPVSGESYVRLEGTLVDVANIKPSEIGYWIPISNYEFENSINEARRDIKLVNHALTFQVEKDLKRLLK